MLSSPQASLAKLMKRFSLPPEGQHCYVQRIEEEYAGMRLAQFESAFNRTLEFAEELKTRGAQICLARGPITCSLLAYAEGLTEVDPVALGLPFQMFFNCERVVEFQTAVLVDQPFLSTAQSIQASRAEFVSIPGLAIDPWPYRFPARYAFSGQGWQERWECIFGHTAPPPPSPGVENSPPDLVRYIARALAGATAVESGPEVLWAEDWIMDMHRHTGKTLEECELRYRAHRRGRAGASIPGMRSARHAIPLYCFVSEAIFLSTF